MSSASPLSSYSSLHNFRSPDADIDNFPHILHLPDGQTFFVTKVFGGMGFRSHQDSPSSHAFPLGWTVSLRTEELIRSDERESKKHIVPFKKPTRQSDAISISSTSSPDSSDLRPPPSHSRQMAMFLWISLYWYFQQHEPSPFLNTKEAGLTPYFARPKGDWKIKISRVGIMEDEGLISNLEMMGLVYSANTSVRSGAGERCGDWSDVFASRQMFWQLPYEMFLFKFEPSRGLMSPPEPIMPSRSDSSDNEDAPSRQIYQHYPELTDGSQVVMKVTSVPQPSPYFLSMPLQYTFTKGIRHPLRPRPPNMGETFYSRFIPSVGQYLSFRVASNSSVPVPHVGPRGPLSDRGNSDVCQLSDGELLRKWMSSPRVNAFWGDYTPDFLDKLLSCPHSFPVIGMWDGVPFGYFEIYWVKEDILGQTLGADAADFDRGLHVLVGEEWARGRVSSWLSSLAHWCLTSDVRTINICLEPRIDNTRFLTLLQENSFFKQRQVSFPHKQSWYMKMSRDQWEGPAL